MIQNEINIFLALFYFIKELGMLPSTAVYLVKHW
jgi:hypothetical protein